MMFDKDFLEKNILIVSDSNNEYTEFEKTEEKKYLEKLFNQIKEHGIKVIIEEVLNEKELRNVLSKYDKNNVIIFNWCERFNNTDGTETAVTKIYEELGFVFTGGSTRTLELVSNKYKCIQTLQSAKIKVPESHFVTENEVETLNLDFSKKYIIKSNKLHASAGISMLNIVATKQDFVAVAKGLMKDTKSDVLIQKFIEGEEYTIMVWGNSEPEVLPIIKVNYENKNLPNILTYSAKFEMEGEEYKNSVYTMLDKSDIIYSRIEKSVLDAYKAIGMEDYARFEVRVNNGEVYIIDYNANPYINSLSENDMCEVFKCTRELGYNWGETILRICEFAFFRNQSKKK